MKRTLTALAATLALASVPRTSAAFSLFSSEESRRLDAAAEAVEAADEARAAGRVMDEIEFLSEAGRTLASLSGDFPDYKADKVFEMRKANAERLRELMSALRSGEIAVPEPDAAWRGEDAASVAKPAERDEALSDAPAFRLGIPELVRVESPETPAAPEAESGEKVEEGAAPDGGQAGLADAAAQRRIESPIPNPFFTEEDGNAAESGAEAVQAVSGETASVAVAAAESDANGELDTDLKAVAEMIRTARAPDAVLLLEDIIESAGDRTPLAARILFARALLECRNYPRARATLDALPAYADSDPSVRSLRAAVNLATGRTTEALLQLDQLIAENPEWSDAYIDCAYVMFLLNPEENRDEAISYYRTGLSFGARRDARLERELGVKVGE